MQATGRLAPMRTRPGAPAVMPGDLGNAEQNAVRWLVRSLGLLRVAQLVPGTVVVLTAAWAYHSATASAVLFGVEVVWSALLFRSALRRGWFTQSWMVADAALQAFVAVAVGRLCLAGYATQAPNWALGPINGAVILASLFLSRAALAGVTSLLLAGYVVGLGPDLVTHWTNALTNVAFIAAVAWAASIVGQRLLHDARLVDVATSEAAAAEQARARAEARYDERARQYRRLHDTVLSTLEGISRGGLDFAQDSVRQRCAADANLVRSLNAAVDETTEFSALPVALGDVVHAIEAFGLTVHLSIDRTSPSLPADVAEAAAGAVREALNNVLKHADVNEAWVSTLSLPDDGVLIRVVDRGVGFDPAQVSTDGGVDGSIRRRWADVGGVVDIDSGPMGTMVELTWQT